MLERIGLSGVDLHIYRHVVRAAGHTISGLADATELPEARVRAAVARLRELHLLVVDATDRVHANLAGPEVAVERLRAGMDEEYHEQRRKVAALHGELSQIVSEGLLTAAGGPESPVDVLHDPDMARIRLLALTGYSREELLWMSTAPVVAGPSPSGAPEFKALRRGVDMRIIAPVTSLLGDCSADGGGTATLRVVHRCPVDLHVFDHRIAFLGNGSRTSFLVRSPELVNVLHTLFDTWWSMGSTAQADQDGQGDGDVVLLQLLSEGLKDENAARKLGMSVRTVRRKISFLLDRLDASSRFQAGVRAARRGWV